MMVHATVPRYFLYDDAVVGSATCASFASSTIYIFLRMSFVYLSIAVCCFVFWLCSWARAGAQRERESEWHRLYVRVISCNNKFRAPNEVHGKASHVPFSVQCVKHDFNDVSNYMNAFFVILLCFVDSFSYIPCVPRELLLCTHTTNSNPSVQWTNVLDALFEVRSSVPSNVLAFIHNQRIQLFELQF